MPFIKKSHLLILISCVFFLTTSTVFAEPLSLREKIPKEAIAYLRVPHLWDFFASPALTQEKQKDLKAAIVKNITEQNEVIGLLAQHLNSPLEAVFLLPEDMPPPFLSVLLSVQLDLTSLEEMNTLLEKVTTQLPFIKKVSDLSAKGYGALTIEEVPVFVHYAVESQTLSLMGGVAASLEKFQATLNITSPVEEQLLHRLEAQIDTSHQGLFYWLNLQRLMPFMQASLPPDQTVLWQKWGLAEMQALAVGWGTRDGKSRLKFVLDAPKAGYRELIPNVTNDFSLTAAGRPGGFFALNLPVLELLAGVEKVLETEAMTTQLADYKKAKQKFQDELGFTPEEPFNAVGNEIVIFSDEVGVFLAVKVKDNEKWTTLLTKLVEKFKLTYETREIQGKMYHHLVFPSLFSAKDLPTDGDAAKEFLAILLINFKTHYYWVEDKGYLLFSDVPQALIEHQNHAQSAPLHTWLKDTQRQDPTSTVLLLSTNLQDVPRYLYYGYLKTLNMLADSVGSQLDLFTLPTPNDLNLPREGTYGMQVNLSDSAVTAELTFENNPLEFFLATNSHMTGVAVIGILAAVAIPANADYIKRAKVSEGIQLLGGLKTPAEEYLASKGQLPEVSEITEKNSGKYTKRIWLLESGDGYGAEFNDPDIRGTLKLLYDKETNKWRCTHEGMQERYLPAVCK